MQLFQGILLVRSSRLRWWCYFSGRLEVVMMIDLPARIVKTQQCFLFLQCSSKEHNLVMGLALPYNRLQITVVRMFMGQQKSINFFLARDYCSCPMALWGYIFSSKTHTQRLEQKHSKNRICLQSERSEQNLAQDYCTLFGSFLEPQYLFGPLNKVVFFVFLF